MFIRSFTIGSLVLALSGCGGSSNDGNNAAPSESTGGSETGTGGAPAASGGSVAATGGTATATGGSATGTGGAGTMPVGTQEASFVMDSFSVPVGGEFYKCQDFPNTFGQNIAILESTSVMSPGSHHMFVFRLSSAGFFGGTPNLGPNNTKGPLVDCPSGGTEFHPFVHAAQTPTQVFTYPPGIGQAFNSDETVRVMVHYLNTGTTTIPASVNVTLDYVPADQVQQLAAAVFLNSVGIKVPPGTSTQGFTYQLTQDISLLAASGHMHRRGTHFSGDAIASDGTTTQLYQTDTWDEPTAAAFNPAMQIASGTTIHWACTYNNTTGQTLSFGESANTNEMCIFTGTYYPAPGGSGIYIQDFNPGTSN